MPFNRTFKYIEHTFGLTHADMKPKLSLNHLPLIDTLIINLDFKERTRIVTSLKVILVLLGKPYNIQFLGKTHKKGVFSVRTTKRERGRGGG